MARSFRARDSGRVHRAALEGFPNVPDVRAHWVARVHSRHRAGSLFASFVPSALALVRTRRSPFRSRVLFSNRVLLCVLFSFGEALWLTTFGFSMFIVPFQNCRCDCQTAAERACRRCQVCPDVESKRACRVVRLRYCARALPGPCNVETRCGGRAPVASSNGV